MKVLFALDKKDYTEDMPVVERYAVRAIIKQNGKYAMQKSSLGEYKIPGGGVEAGESYEQALLREVREETGLLVKTETIKEIGEVLEIKEDKKNKGHKYVAHSLYYECEVAPEMVTTEMTESELSKGYQLEWAELQHIIVENMKRQNENWVIRDTEFLKRAYLIGDIVKVTVDRPLGSYHPKHKDIYYPINYGYIAGIMAPDGEEQDAYILGVDEPVKEFTGKIIAIIHRFNDVEEKWVVAPENVIFTKDEIMEQVKFQEQYFKSEVIM